MIGLMSGTSADGVHAALVEVSGGGLNSTVKLIRFEKTPYPPELRHAIFALFSPTCPGLEICRLNFALGHFFAEAALDLMRRCRVRPSEVDLVASHGQTIYHLPRREKLPGGANSGSTLQIGEPSVIAEVTGVLTVADFRTRDVAAGGQGAPLVPFADYLLFRSADKGRAVQNIGGIANVTAMPRGAALDDVFAFDTGPGNMVIDGVVEAVTGGIHAFDEDGRIASGGRVDQSLLSWMMEHDFIKASPPKTAGREQFGAHFVEEVLQRGRDLPPADLVATATAFTAESIAFNYHKFVFPACSVDEVILGGGGSYNSTMRRMLRERLGELTILLHEDVGVLGDAKEAMAFAILGNETVLGNPSNLPRATGATGPAILGKIILP